MPTTTLQPTNISLLSLFCSVNFKADRINIAEWELSENFLTLYLEDADEPVADLSDCLLFKLPISKLAQIIEAAHLNSYEGTLFTESGRMYEGRVVIAEPIKWYEQDATHYQQKEALDVVKGCLLKSLVK
jgi:hypothetical protein